MTEQELTPINGSVAVLAGRPAWTQTFLAALSAGSNVKAAAEAAKIARRTAYDRKEIDAEFAREWDRAIREGIDHVTDMIEAEAIRRAMEYSDHLLLAILRARKPEYRQHAIIETAAPLNLDDARQELMKKFERFAANGEAAESKEGADVVES